MGFGEGSFDSGGSDFGGSFDSFSSSSSSSDSYSGDGGSGECTKEGFFLFSSITFGFGFVVCCFLMGVSPSVELRYCVNGLSLNPKEQMWCTPLIATTVRTEYFAPSVSVYRMRKSELPDRVFRHDEQNMSFPLRQNMYKYYSFEMMPGSSISARISSSSYSDKCFFMDYENFLKFCDRGHYKPIMDGPGVLSVTYSVTVADNYYFVVYHPGSGTVTVSFDMSFNYSVYNVSQFKPDPCSLEGRCTFHDVGSDEIIIADSNSDKELDFHLLLPDQVNSSSSVVLIVLLIAFGLLMIGFISLYVWFCHFANKKSDTDKEEDSIPLMETEKTPSSETPASDPVTGELPPESPEKTALPTIPYLEALPAYQA